MVRKNKPNNNKVKKNTYQCRYPQRTILIPDTVTTEVWSYIILHLYIKVLITNLTTVLVLSITFKDGVLVTCKTFIPQLDLLGIQSKIKAFFGNQKLSSILCLDSLIDDEYVDVIYVTDNTYIEYRCEYMLYEWMDGHPGSEVLDSPCGDKNVCIYLVVYESKEASNEAIF